MAVTLGKMSAVASTAFLVACSTVLPNGIPSKPQTADEFSIGLEDWYVGCQLDQFDPYGKLVEKAKCWTFVSYRGNSNLGIEMSVVTIFEVDQKRGPRLMTAPAFDTNICDEVPTQKAVDGKPIHRLPMKQQIEAVLSGQVYVREADNQWPQCNVYNQVTTTQGARRAYNRMMEKWAAMASVPKPEAKP